MAQEDTRNLARFFTEQRQVAWVALGVVILWGFYGLAGMPQRFVFVLQPPEH